MRPPPRRSLAGDTSGWTDSCPEGARDLHPHGRRTTSDARDPPPSPVPAKLPPRVLDAGEGLRGRYAIVRISQAGWPYALGELGVTTYCLRAGDRCMSYFPFAGR